MVRVLYEDTSVELEKDDYLVAADTCFWEARRDVLSTREWKRQGREVHAARRWSLSMRIHTPWPGPPPIIS
jgi:hypothetical protein